MVAGQEVAQGIEEVIVRAQGRRIARGRIHNGKCDGQIAAVASSENLEGTWGGVQFCGKSIGGANSYQVGAIEG